MRRMTLIAALGAFLPLLIAAHVLDLGLGGVWAGIAAFIAVRMLLGALRWRSRRWLVAGTLMVDERPDRGRVRHVSSDFLALAARECQLRLAGSQDACL